MERLFAVSGLFVLPFWALLIGLPRWRWTERLMRSPLVVLGPVLLYAALVLPALASILPVVARPALGPVADLLGSPLGATVAWAHFLAFDLFVARWIYLDARERQLSAWWLSPIMLMTLLLGPIGLGSYLLLRAPIWARVRGAAADFLRSARAGSRPLVLMAAASAALLAITLVMPLVDSRQVLGVSTWLKPAKFAVSIALGAITLAWIINQLGPVSRGVRRAAGIMVVSLAVELLVITVQAARGVPSHFNNATMLGLVLFQIMGISISIFWGAQAYLAWRTFRHDFADRALGWGIRLGLVATLLGGLQGFLMPRPNPAQLASLRAGQATPMIGAHTVGAPDGGPGMPVTGWSTTAGDLRVAHFVGLHGLQILPLVGFGVSQAFRRRQRRSTQASPALAPRLVIFAAGGYLGLMVATVVQALHGRALLGQGGPTGDALALGLGATVWAMVALLAVFERKRKDIGVPASLQHDQVAAPRAA